MTANIEDASALDHTLQRATSARGMARCANHMAHRFQSSAISPNHDVGTRALLEDG